VSFGRICAKISIIFLVRQVTNVAVFGSAAIITRRRCVCSAAGPGWLGVRCGYNHRARVLLSVAAYRLGREKKTENAINTPRCRFCLESRRVHCRRVPIAGRCHVNRPTVTKQSSRKTRGSAHDPGGGFVDFRKHAHGSAVSTPAYVPVVPW